MKFKRVSIDSLWPGDIIALGWPGAWSKNAVGKIVSISIDEQDNTIINFGLLYYANSEDPCGSFVDPHDGPNKYPKFYKTAMLLVGGFNV